VQDRAAPLLAQALHMDSASRGAVMSKRQFRTTAPASRSVSYPTLDEFDRSSRRSFLARLAGAALGAGAMAALAACDSRAVGLSDSKAAPDGGPDPDFGGPSGAAPSPDAKVDQRKKIDLPQTTMGEAPAPDAQIDKTDLETTMGKQRAPDARIDEPDGQIAGGAPMPPAGLDGGCSNPPRP
jgi:hypothetical protein